MTNEEKEIVAIEYLESKGNSCDEACVILAGLLFEATMELPQRAFYSKAYCDLKRIQKNTAIVQLRKIPYGEELMMFDLSNMGI